MGNKKNGEWEYVSYGPDHTAIREIYDADPDKWELWFHTEFWYPIDKGDRNLGWMRSNQYRMKRRQLAAAPTMMQAEAHTAAQVRKAERDRLVWEMMTKLLPVMITYESNIGQCPTDAEAREWAMGESIRATDEYLKWRASNDKQGTREI